MWHLAWRNIRHYRGRTIVTFLLTFFSALLFIVYVAFMDGSHAHSLKSALGVYNGAMQIFHKGYRDEGGYDYLIEEVQSVETILAHTDGIRAYAPRLESYALLSTPGDSAGAMVTGIDPERERQLSKAAESLREGRYLNAEDTQAIYLGQGLAQRLKVGVGDEVALVGSATDYSFAADTFTVVGLFKTGLFSFDAQSAFVNKHYFDTVMLSEGMASYVVVALEELDDLGSVTAAVRARLPETLEAVPWTTLMKAQVQAMEVDSVFGYISMGVFFIVIFFVIMIFSFLNVMGRTRELGMLRAIGLSPGDVTRLLYLEALLIAVAATLPAILIGAPIAWHYALHPIVIEGIAEAYKEYGIVNDQIPMRFDPPTILWNAAVVFGLNLLAVIYPIRLVNRQSPMEAMRHV